MKNKLLSIVIPVYNVEKYIEKCLLSCIKQDISHTDYEIIVVNDGTPDNSLTIVKHIANNYSNIKIINQENQGLSAARNNGLKSAKGEYVWFVDGDDYIEENCLGRIVTHLKGRLDILQLQYRYVYEDDTPALDINSYKIDGIKTGLEIMEQGGLPDPVPFSIFRTTFLKENDLEFVRGIYHEDSEFKPRSVYLAQKISSDTFVSYNYLQRLSGSITSSFKLKNALDILKVNKSLIEFVQRQNMSCKCRKCLYQKIGLNMNTLLYGIRQLSEKDRILLIQQLKIDKKIFDYMIKSSSLKYMVEGLIFKLNIKLGLVLHRYIR